MENEYYINLSSHPPELDENISMFFKNTIQASFNQSHLYKIIIKTLKFIKENNLIEDIQEYDNLDSKTNLWLNSLRDKYIFITKNYISINLATISKEYIINVNKMSSNTFSRHFIYLDKCILKYSQLS